jgi:hypothetical protein
VWGIYANVGAPHFYEEIIMAEYLLQEMYDALIEESGSLRNASSSSLSMLALGNNLPENIFKELLKAEDTGAIFEIVNNSTTPVKYLFDIFYYITWQSDTKTFFNKSIGVKLSRRITLEQISY